MSLRPLADTLLDFGGPELSSMGNASLDELRGAMLGVVTIWNAHVLARPEHGRPEVLPLLEQRLRASGRAELAETFERLSRRFRARFADDPRLVGPWAVERTADGRGLSFTAEVGLPPPPEADPAAAFAAAVTAAAAARSRPPPDRS